MKAGKTRKALDSYLIDAGVSMDDHLAAEAELTELECLAEIGRATEWFYSQGFMITKHRLNTITALLTIKDAVEWHRVQESK